MTNYRYRLTVLTSLLIFMSLWSCKKDKDQDTNLILSNLKDEFHINLLERLSPNGPELVLQIHTIEQVRCANSNLDYSLEQSSGKVVISINDISQPADPDCVKTPSWLTTDIPLGHLPNGPTDIEINIRKTVSNVGKLRQEDRLYQLDMTTDYVIEITQQKLYKISPNTIWGYIGHKTENSPLVDQFFTELAELTEEGDFEEGYYGHFIYDKSAEDIVAFDDNHELPYSSRFLLRLTSDKAELKAFLDQFRQDYGAYIELEVRTWEGEAF